MYQFTQTFDDVPTLLAHLIVKNGGYKQLMADIATASYMLHNTAVDRKASSVATAYEEIGHNIHSLLESTGEQWDGNIAHARFKDID